MKLMPKAADIIIILLSASFAFSAFFLVFAKQQGSAQVLIRAQDEEYIFPANAEETIIVSGMLGDTIVRIGERRAWIESSPCDNKTCVASGFVSKHGQWAACLPNNVLLLIHGAINKEEENVDTIVW